MKKLLKTCCKRKVAVFMVAYFQKKSDFKVHYRSKTYYPGHFLTLKKYSIFVLQQVFTLLACCSLSAPSFGVDWVKDRTYTSSSYGMLGVNYDLGYHCTDSIKISVGYIIKPIINSL